VPDPHWYKVPHCRTFVSHSITSPNSYCMNMNISHSCTCTNVDSTGLNGIHVYFYRLEEPILHLLGGLWTCLLVITSPNQNLCG